MARQQTIVKGVTTNSVYEDGDTYSLVNLRAKNNALQPIVPRGDDGAVCGDYDIYYIHTNLDYEHWIGVDKFTETNKKGEEDNYFSAYWNIKADAEGVCPERKVIQEHVKGTLTGVQSTGNLLIFVCKETIYYALWKDNDYLWIGELPDLLPIEFNCYEEKIAYGTFADCNIGTKAGVEWTNEWEVIKNYIKALFVVLNLRLQSGDQTLSSSTIIPNEEKDFKGWLTSARLVRYAYRLYDGTTIKASCPILIMPASPLVNSWKFAAQIQEGHVDAGIGALNREERNWLDVASGAVLTGFVPGMRYDFTSLAKYKDIITSVDLFMSPPLLNLIEAPSDDWNSDLKNAIATITGKVSNEPDDENWNNIYYGNLVPSYPDEMMAALKANSSFYKIREIEIGTKSANDDAAKKDFIKLFNTNEDYYKVRNLLYQEELAVDTFSHQKEGADLSYMYNKRLHIAGVNTTFYGGFDYAYFRWENQPWGVQMTHDYYGEIVPQYVFRGNDTYDRYDYGYNGFLKPYNVPPSAIGNRTNPFNDNKYCLKNLMKNYGATDVKIVVKVDIKIAGSIYPVFSECEVTDESVFGFMSSYLSYPDARAFKMTFYVTEVINNTTRWRHTGEVALVPHDFLNIAYFVRDGLRPIYLNPFPMQITLYDFGDDYDFCQLSDPKYVDEPEGYKAWKEASTDKWEGNPHYGNVTISEDNKIKTSQTSNPFYFPNENVNLVGNGKILALATNRQNVGDRNYGMYPLYVFAEDGVWTLAVGDGDVPYKNVTQPVFGEAPSNGVICPTPYGVCFITRRGLFMINGNKVTYLSAKLDEEPRHLNIEDSPHITDVIIHNHPLWIRTFLQDADAMFYNPFENEVIMRNPSQKFHWVIDLDGGMFYQSTQTANKVVENVISGLLVIGDEVNGHFPILDYGKESDDPANVSMVIRPLSYGTPDVKKLERMILRGLMTTDTSEIDGAEMFPIVMLHYSDDQVNMKAAAGHQLKIGNRRDIDAGLRGRLKHRWFMTIFAGAVTRDSRIFYLDSEITKEYNNTKMR